MSATAVLMCLLCGHPNEWHQPLHDFDERWPCVKGALNCICACVDFCPDEAAKAEYLRLENDCYVEENLRSVEGKARTLQRAYERAAIKAMEGW